MRNDKRIVALAMAAGLAMTAAASAQITNGGFETGDFTGWTISSSTDAPGIDSTVFHTGSKSALVGNQSGAEPLGDSAFYQQFLVPAGGYHLKFYYRTYTVDSITFDWQDAYIQDSSGTNLATIFHLCSSNATWQLADVDLAPYVGQTIRIAFLVHQDGFGDDTGMWVDDVTVGIPPPPSACCLLDGTCQVLSDTQCGAIAGAVLHPGELTCPPAGGCPQPGACCHPDGTCTQLDGAACTSGGGIYHGADSLCSSFTCPVTQYTESGDAGDLPATAAVTGSSGTALTLINGALGTGDADMYLINICSPANFSATTAGHSSVDTELSLYKLDGTGVTWDDDDPAGTTLQSRLTSQFVSALPAGNYYLAVSQFNKFPTGALGQIWIDDNSTGHEYRVERQPEPGHETDPITGWTSTAGAGGAYGIALTGTCFPGSSCYVNCDQSTGNPALNANDFQCFLNAYAASSALSNAEQIASYANCDHSTGTPALNANDFQCFLNAYAVGCS